MVGSFKMPKATAPKAKADSSDATKSKVAKKNKPAPGAPSSSAKGRVQGGNKKGGAAAPGRGAGASKVKARARAFQEQHIQKSSSKAEEDNPAAVPAEELGTTLSGDKEGFFAGLGGKAYLRQNQQQQQQQQQQHGGARAVEEKDADGRGPALLPPMFDDDDTAGQKEVQAGDQTQSKIMWLELGLCKALIRAVSQVGFFTPTPIQAAAIPVALTGVDVCARAVTGSGKTAAFLLPILHRLLTARGYKQDLSKSKRRYIRALILVPSRELGQQCYEMAKSFLQFTSTVEAALAIGGIAGPAQEAALEKAPELVIGTPGRMVDILMNYKGSYGSIDLSGVEVVAIDEVDKMLTVSIKDQLDAILERCPEESRQTLFFSATMTKEVDEFATELLVKPRNIEIGHVALQSQLRQQFVRVRGTGSSAFPKVARKRPRHLDENGQEQEGGEDAGAEGEEDQEEEVQADDEEPETLADQTTEAQERTEHASKVKSRHLVAVCKKFYPRALIFTKYRSTAHRLAVLFNALGMPCADLQGNQSQEERTKNYSDFGDRTIDFLICTDVASRGLDVPNVEVVINYDMPPTLTAYIHRVGRTARIGSKGTAVSLVDETEDADIMRKIIAVSSNVNKHQIATVRRRDVTDEDLAEATHAIDAIFSKVKATLATEVLEQKLAEVEKKLARQPDGAGVNSVLTTQAKKQWVLSKKEKAKRDEESKENYKNEAEVVVEETKAELAELERVEQQRLGKQKITRAKKRIQLERKEDKAREERRALRRKETQKFEKGRVRKEKQAQIRKAKKERRKEDRAASGKKPAKKRDSKQHMKNRRRGRVRKH